MRLSDVHEGDRVRLVSVEGRDAQRWLLLMGFIENLPAEVVKRTVDGSVLLSVGGRPRRVPSRIARAAVVHRCGVVP